MWKYFQSLRENRLLEKEELQNIELQFEDVITEKGRRIRRDKLPKSHVLDPTITTKYIVFFLLIVAVASGIGHGGLLSFADFLMRTKLSLATQIANPVLRYFVWVIYTVGLACISLTIVWKVSPYIAGSGVPYIKTILSGGGSTQYIGLRILFGKWVALLCVAGAAMYVGIIGPFVHFGVMVAHNLMTYVPYFKRLKKNPHIYIQMLTVSGSIGMAAATGAPIGGTLFGIEVTTAFYQTRNYWWTHLVAPIGASVFLFIWNGYRLRNGTYLFHGYYHTDSPYPPFQTVEILSYLLLGAVMGLLAAFYSVLITQFAYQRRRLANKYWIMKIPYFYPVLVVLLFATLTFPDFSIPPASYPNIRTVSNMFSVNLPPEWGTNFNQKLLRLSCVFLLRYFLSPMIFTLPIPAGMFTPSLVIGSIFGRFYGEIMLYIFPNGFFGVPIYPFSYAIVGAATYVASFTHTLSAAVLVLEFTQNLNFLFPVTMSCVVGIMIYRQFANSNYDSMAFILGLKFIPDIKFYNGGWEEEIAPLVMYVQEKAPDDGVIPSSVEDRYELRLSPSDKLITDYVYLEDEGFLELMIKYAYKTLEPESIELLFFSVKDIYSVFISSDITIMEAHFLFCVLRLPFLTVVDNGRPIGILTREALQAYITPYVRSSKKVLRLIFSRPNRPRSIYEHAQH